MYAESKFSPPKLDYPYQRQQQLSGSSSSSKKQPAKQFSNQDNEKLKEALEKASA